MRNRHWLAIVAAGAISLGALGAPGLAQAPAPAPAQPQPPFNPTLSNCNVTPDTQDAKDPKNPNKRIPTPITADLLSSGQPCQQRVSTVGLTSSGLDNLQRGFDFYSWLTFLALNSPADGKIIGQGPRPGGDAVTRWEVLRNYRQLADVMLEDGGKPVWGGDPIVPKECQSLNPRGKMILKLGEAAWNQPFRTGPLIDQNGHYALFDILMNQVMFRYITDNDLYSRQGQEKFEQNIAFPEGVNVDTSTRTGTMGAVMLKVSWRILDPEKDKALMDKFHTVDALVYFPGPRPDGGGTKTGPACVEKKLGLIGFHAGHKTKFAPQWVWTSFEHVSNAPTQKEVHDKKLHPPYSFFNADCKRCVNGDCKTCVANDTPPDPWDPPKSLVFHSGDRSQVVRTTILPDVVANEVADLNRQFRALLKGTVWENYELLATQWPSDNTSKTDCNGQPAPTFLANTTLETYSQGVIPLASSSCMACHGNATTQHDSATPSDFTFILEKAQCEKGVCPPTQAKNSDKNNKLCGLVPPPH
jgi:hypothetical protein